MKSILIKGNQYLNGTIKISGSKNAAIPIICSALLAKGKVLLKNVARITDVYDLVTILRYLDCKIVFKGHSLYIDNTHLKYKPLLLPECRKIRGSYYFIGVFLTLFSKCEILLPGGCEIGSRPIDIHLAAFKDLGYVYFIEKDILKINIQTKIDNPNLTLKHKSVGATLNALFASLSCESFKISNYLLEPEGMDVLRFLNKIGYRIEMENELNYKKTRLEYKNLKYKIIPDRIETFTYIVIGLLNGNLKIKNTNPNDLIYPIEILKKSGYIININNDEITVNKSLGKAFSITTTNYPGFPTDMQPLLGVLALFSIGTTNIKETIFEKRFNLYNDLKSMNVDIEINKNEVKFCGISRLESTKMLVKDLRHGAALIALGLKMDGVSQINNFEIIERGYEDIIGKLISVNAKIKEITS